MSESVKIKFSGFKELNEILSELPEELAKGALKMGMRNGAKLVLEEAKRLVPVKTGNLRDSLYIKSIGKVKSMIVYKVISGRNNGRKGFHAHLVELGTKPHLIKPKKKFLVFGSTISKEVNHPGMRKQPFMRPALSNKAPDVIKEVAESTSKSIIKRLKKYLKK